MAINKIIEDILRELHDPKIQELIKISDELNLLSGSCRIAYQEAKKTNDWTAYNLLKSIKKEKEEKLIYEQKRGNY